MNKFYKCLVITVLIIVPAITSADKFSSEASYQVCFTPGQNCAQMIIDEINKARKQILVQMYTFTSMPIMRALIAAKNKGVDVKILLDKSQVCSKYSLLDFFIKNKISVQIDRVRGIAHNNVLILDGVTTIGGSFNYTDNAQKNNVENVIVIRDAVFSKRYIDNWHSRREHVDNLKGKVCCKKNPA